MCGAVWSVAVKTPAPARTAVLLGAQRCEPTLGTVVSRLGIDGPIALITAGWQEREPEDDELSAHLGGHTTNLHLHARGNQVFQSDPDLAAAHRERQDLLRHLQDIYRIRLEHAFMAERDVAAYDAPAAIRDEVAAASVESIRALDTWHIGHCNSVRADFEQRMAVHTRKEVIRHRKELAVLLKGTSAVAIAGGHVALLLNRLQLFGLDELIGDRPIFAWSAGAMAISERIVLFHDDPPEGRVAREVLDTGLGRATGVVVLPEPERRLDLKASERTGVMARRFAPSRCLAFPSRSFAIFQDGVCTETEGVVELATDGTTSTFGTFGSSTKSATPASSSSASSTAAKTTKAQKTQPPAPASTPPMAVDPDAPMVVATPRASTRPRSTRGVDVTAEGAPVVSQSGRAVRAKTAKPDKSEKSDKDAT